MLSFSDSKSMAKALRKGLAERRIDISHSDSLELVARQFGFANWNMLAARIDGEPAELKLPSDWIVSGGSPEHYRLGLDPELPGVVKIVRDGNFLAVVAEKEFQAIKAMNVLATAAKWKVAASLPKQDDLFKVLTALPSQDTTIFERSNPAAAGQKTIEATYTRPYQAHGSIGPSCAVAQWIDGAMTVWTHTQGVYPDRQGIAEMLRVPPAHSVVPSQYSP